MKRLSIDEQRRLLEDAYAQPGASLAVRIECLIDEVNKYRRAAERAKKRCGCVGPSHRGSCSKAVLPL